MFVRNFKCINMSELKNLPPQQLPMSRKTKEWRKKHLEWADSKTSFSHDLVRRSLNHKRINYNLLNGRLDMSDMQLIVNPDNIQASYIPEKIQHYPIMNRLVNVLRGEELDRVFDFKAIVTNPNSISEIEDNKKDQLFGRLQDIVSRNTSSEEEYMAEIEELNDYYRYDWQDLREMRANAFINHYSKEYNLALLFNEGFVDAITCGEEIYQCDIVGGEPVIDRVNPLKIRMFRSGYSNKIEDADVVILEDYWSVSKIIDAYYDVLNPNDIKYLENIPDFESSSDEMDNFDERNNFISVDAVLDTDGGNLVGDTLSLFTGENIGGGRYYDSAGNVRVLRVYWKSRRKIKEIKSYDPLTGEEMYNFYPESYIPDVNMGEEELSFWINEAWEATQIGKQIYVNMRPRVVQYNSLSNPSRCHFGIVGSIYNLNERRPFSIVDMMKPYNYQYNIIHDRLNKAMATSWGKIARLDLALIPKGWKIEQWMHFIRVNKIAVIDSFKEGNIGASTGRLAGSVAQNSSTALDLESGNYIQQNLNLLEYIENTMMASVGISPERLSQISSRETVGGIERSVLQSNHMTEWLYMRHDDVKKRSLECFLETSKIALKGRSKKFRYILPDMSLEMVEINGDEFSENDYGVVLDNSKGSQLLNSKLETLAQAALQNQALSFSAIMKLYGSSSLAEKQRLIEKDEAAMQERAAQAQQQQSEAVQYAAQVEAEQREADREQNDELNARDNETKVLIEEMKLSATEMQTPAQLAELGEKIRQFNEKLSADRQRLEFDKKVHADEISVKREQNRVQQARKQQFKNNAK